MVNLLYLAVFVVTAYGLGNYLLDLARFKFKSFGEQAIFAQALGMIIFSYATLILGLIGILHGNFFRIIVVILLLLFYGRIKRFILYLWHVVVHSSLFSFKFDKLLFLLLIILVILNLTAALAPVHASDAVSYHIAVPKLYAEAGKIYDIPYNIPSNYPLGIDMLFLDGYLLNSGELGELIAVYIGILLAAAIYFFSLRYFSKRVALLAAVIFYTIPLFSVFNIRAFVDIATGLYTFLGVYAFFMWRKNENKKILLLGAVMAGFAMTTKTSAILAPGILGLFFLYESVLVKKRLSAVKDLILYGAVAVAVSVPYNIRALVNTGNPVYPLFYEVFKGEYINPVLAQYWVEILNKVGFGATLADLVLLPWNVTMHSEAFGELVGIGSMFLVFVPLLFIMKNVDKKITLLLVMTVAFLLPWFFTAQILRYIFVVYAMLSIVVAYTVSRMLKEKSLRLIVVIGFSIILLTNLLIWVGANVDEVNVALGVGSEEEFLREKITNHEIIEYANENLDGARICLYGEMRGYYSENDYVWCHPAYQGYVDFSTINNKEQLIGRFSEIGVTHILVENSMQAWRGLYYERNIGSGIILLNNGDKAVSELIADSILLYENENGALYELKE